MYLATGRLHSSRLKLSTQAARSEDIKSARLQVWQDYRLSTAERNADLQLVVCALQPKCPSTHRTSLFNVSHSDQRLSKRHRQSTPQTDKNDSTNHSADCPLVLLSFSSLESCTIAKSMLPAWRERENDFMIPSVKNRLCRTTARWVDGEFVNKSPKSSVARGPDGMVRCPVPKHLLLRPAQHRGTLQPFRPLTWSLRAPKSECFALSPCL